MAERAVYSRGAGVLALDRAERRVALVSISCRVLALRTAVVFVSEVLRVSKAVDLHRLPAAATVPTVLARAQLVVPTPPKTSGFLATYRIVLLNRLTSLNVALYRATHLEVI